MSREVQNEIIIRGGRANNLKDVDLNIPHNKLIVATGVSGSGKSSLVFDIIAKEGQRRYFETLPSFARQFAGKLNRPDVDVLKGLAPVIAIGQQTSGMHVRSTVGTMSDVYDLLRLLYARTGTSKNNIKLSRSLFSFNSETGKCPNCMGVGQEEEIDLGRLVSEPEKTIREGALAPTLPTGYIMYSQVTIDVLNQVCEAEGFDVDIPWNALSESQRKIVLYGSQKIKVPFGKHSLESRLKWTGIKAKPREEGFYKGMIPIMSDILRRDRNVNILKYVSAVTCKKCKGARLSEEALGVEVHQMNIADLAQLGLDELNDWIKSKKWNEIGRPIVEKITKQINLLSDLGLGHLQLNRPAKTLSASEIQRIRVANQISASLSNVLYVFDEPSIGLHREENIRMIHYFKELVGKGNTVIVVEHNLDTIRHADHILDIGPKAGVNGGEILFNGSLKAFLEAKDLKGLSPTFNALNQTEQVEPRNKIQANKGKITLKSCHENNLRNIDVEFSLGELNVVSGKSGSGKSSLVKGTLLQLIKKHLGADMESRLKLKGYENLEAIDKLVFIDHSPIGKTPRSNPATYLGLSDHIRDLYAKTDESKWRGYSKSRFSFNNKGGRCETCQGAGKIQIGMHFLGNIDLLCGTCSGKRFNEDTLSIEFKGKSIADVYRMSVNEAKLFFEGEKKVVAGLEVLQKIGLGYLTLGQSSTTLSGGEAQRVKIANQLQKKDTGDTLYIIIEPSIGLHHSNVRSLLAMFDTIKEHGNTIVCVEQNKQIIQECDWHIELGPENGKKGGRLIHQGAPRADFPEIVNIQEDERALENNDIHLKGVRTHSLKNIDVRIPKNALTVVTGVSGSGKSSLVYDTLLAESKSLFAESLSTHVRSYIQQDNEAVIESYSGLGPAIGINRKAGTASKRSTVGTMSGIYDLFRLLYSRIAQHDGQTFTAQHYSFNHHLGACLACGGIGANLKCDPLKIIGDASVSVLDGAISSAKGIGYYSDAGGQFMATLQEAASQNKWNLSLPWCDLEVHVKDAILYGTGDKEWEVQWTFNTKSRSGTQNLKAKWLGFCNYIDDEYQRRQHNKNIKELEVLLHEEICQVCAGSRLKPELLTTRFLNLNIFQLTQISIRDCLNLLCQNDQKGEEVIRAIGEKVLPNAIYALQSLAALGLGYLSLDRAVNTLSGGETQRVHLAGQLSNHLFGVTYVLDEPSIGLDKAQVQVLIEILQGLVANGNTVVVVEHDTSIICAAQNLIELGPGAGNLGGELVFQGSLDMLKKYPGSLTYKVLNTSQLDVSSKLLNEGLCFGVRGASANNLKRVDLTFNSGNILAVSGVSGSGKSSLIKEVLFKSWEGGRAINCASIFGMEQFEEVVLMDQSPLSASRLVTPASYSGILDTIRNVFSKTQDAKDRSLKKADFSYLSKNGKCPSCNGHGRLKTSMDFMSDVWLPCDACNGKRYNSQVLSCQLHGLSVGDVLMLTVHDAIQFFEDSKITNALTWMDQLGIGHLRLGQSANTLSGGEAQRLKLATAMMKKQSGSSLFIFDEPSTGLHYFDILKLQEVFEKLIQQGDTVLFIEHNSTLLDFADQRVTLGPGSGSEGGELI